MLYVDTDRERISRKELYSDEEMEDEQVILPKLDFEIVDAQIDEPQESAMDDEFDFPLFSFGGATNVTELVHEAEEERGRTLEKSTLVKVSLRSPSPMLKQERPMSYYRANYTAVQRDNLQKSAISYEEIIRDASFTVNNPHDKVIDLAKYNANVERDIQSLKKNKFRPGKKARLARIRSRQGLKERKNYQKLLDEEAMKKLLKKINRTRGGKKHKKKKADPEAQSVQITQDQSAAKPQGVAKPEPRKTLGKQQNKGKGKLQPSKANKRLK